MAALAPHAQHNTHLSPPASIVSHRAPPSPGASLRSVRIKSPPPFERSHRHSASTSSLTSLPSPARLPVVPSSPALSPSLPATSSPLSSPSPSIRAVRTPTTPEEKYSLLEQKSLQVSRSLIEAIEDLDAKDSVIAELHHTIGNLTQKLVDLRRDNVQIVKMSRGRSAGAEDEEKDALRRRVAELEAENDMLRRGAGMSSNTRASV